MSHKFAVRRRVALKALAAGAAGLVAGEAAPPAAPSAGPRLKGRVKQCVTKGMLGKRSIEEAAKLCLEIGLVGLDFTGPADWPVLKAHGLAASMVSGAGSIAQGSNAKENHARMLADFTKNIAAAAEHKWRNVITFSGNRRGMSDAEGLENSVILFKEAVKIAEDAGVTICMELLNSKVNHPDYMCDHTAWGAALCARVGSPHLKLLYDIYHMQIMEGDVIRTIRDNIQYIGHFHTAGNPGRRDLDADQELNYKAIMDAIATLTEEKKYDGFVAHEFGPKKGLDSVKAAIALCDV